MLAVLVYPAFALGSLSRLMGLLAALDSVELVLCSIDLIVTVQFEFSTDVHCDNIFDLLLDSWAFRD